VKGAITTLFWKKVKTAVIVLAAGALVGLGAGLWSARTTPEVNAVPAPENPPRAEKPPARPVILVTASYPGANARDVAQAVAAPLEEQIIGVEGMVRIKSTSGNDGEYTLTVTFKPGVNPDFAQVLVQNRVNLALPQLPDPVTKDGVTIRKKVGNNGGKEL